ncbi:MAG: hypothetical protein WBQ94_27780 [Terracidiphilus sp.]
MRKGETSFDFLVEPLGALWVLKALKYANGFLRIILVDYFERVSLAAFFE